MHALTLSAKVVTVVLLLLSTLLVASPAPAIANAQADQFVFLPLVSRGRPLVNEAIASVEPAATGSPESFYTPLDATPDADANSIYFTALSAQGAGLFRVPATGGSAVTLTVGAPLTVPFGLAINASGTMIYVADTAASVSNQASVADIQAIAACGSKQGGIFAIPSTGGTPVLVAGTACTAPRGVTVVAENNIDMIYFTGVDPSDDQPAVMKIPASGGSFTLLDKGSPLVDPVGITVAQDTRVYVTDQAAGENGFGTVFRIKQGVHNLRTSHREALAKNIRMGSPAGLALTVDDSTLLISALDESTGTSQVVVLNTTTLDQARADQGIGANHASGGLHRALNSNVLAWCGLTAGVGGSGTVYRVELH